MAAEPENWTTAPADYRGDAVVAAMAMGGVDHLFFTSGSELAFYQESIAKARHHNRPVPRIVTVTHEHVSLNAALGYAAVSGKCAATAAHVDCGTQHHGGAIHTAWRSGLPVMITAGGAPSAYPGSMPGSREEGAHLWSQQVFDQGGILRQYTKWDKRLEYQDNPGLMVSRALQVARTEPMGPVYMSFPREIILLPMQGDAKFPTADQLGIARPAAVDQDSAKEIAQKLIKAKNPVVVVSGSGKYKETVPELVSLCELLGLAVVDGAARHFLSFPMNHPLYQNTMSLKDADVVLVLEATVPWMPGPMAPGPSAWIAAIDQDPAKNRFPTYEFTADIRLNASPLLAIRAIRAEAEKLLGASDRSAAADRSKRLAETGAARRRNLADEAMAKAKNTPVDPMFVSHTIAQAIDDNCIVLDESLQEPALSGIRQLLEARLLYPQSGIERRLGAGRGPGRQDRGSRQGCRPGVGRRFLAVRRAQCGALVGEPPSRAVPVDHPPEPQLLDRHKRREVGVRRELRAQGGLSRRLFRSADRLRQGGRGRRRLWRERARPGRARPGDQARPRANPPRHPRRHRGVGSPDRPQGLRKIASLRSQ